jgi:hypothetical protein
MSPEPRPIALEPGDRETSRRPHRAWRVIVADNTPASGSRLHVRIERRECVVATRREEGRELQREVAEVSLAARGARPSSIRTPRPGVRRPGSSPAAWCRSRADSLHPSGPSRRDVRRPAPGATSHQVTDRGTGPSAAPVPSTGRRTAAFAPAMSAPCSPVTSASVPRAAWTPSRRGSPHRGADGREEHHRDGEHREGDQNEPPKWCQPIPEQGGCCKEATRDHQEQRA